jgi:hypothetical protein
LIGWPAHTRGQLIHRSDVLSSISPTCLTIDNITLRGDNHIRGPGIDAEFSSDLRQSLNIDFHGDEIGLDRRGNLRTREDLALHSHAGAARFRPKMDQNEPVGLGRDSLRGFQAWLPSHPGLSDRQAGDRNSA